MNCYIIYKGEESLKHIKVTLHFDDRSKECIVYLVTTNSTDECIERLKKKAEKYLVQNKVIETYSDNGLYKSIFNNISLPWIQFLLQNEPLILRLSQDLALISQQSHILPEPMSVFKIFSIIKPKQVKAILIGQDPYPQTGVADGIAFSTFQENSIPASLKNIFTELKDYENIKVDSKNPDLSRWVRNGCFLINASWTVTENKIGSHGNLWKQFVENLLRYIFRGQFSSKNRRSFLWIRFQNKI